MSSTWLMTSFILKSDRTLNLILIIQTSETKFFTNLVYIFHTNPNGEVIIDFNNKQLYQFDQGGKSLLICHEKKFN